MLVPSIDIMGGETVQLIGGKEKALDAGAPSTWARRFGRVGEVAVIDLDAALGTGDNSELIKPLLRNTRCRVGGGIRDVVKGLRWLDAGAEKIILGTAAVPDILRHLPKERTIAALDAVHGEVVVKGWREKTGKSIQEQMKSLRPWVGGFLVTFVEREGQLLGVDLELIRELAEIAGDAKLTIAGGIATVEEIAVIDQMGVDAQVGMALYTGKFDLASATAACLLSDRPDGLWPTVITDEFGVALGLAYSDIESLRVSLERGVGAYHSRKRGLWVKGESSGATQDLLRVDMDCDRDTLRFVVKQANPGFCHEHTHTCWGDDWGLGTLSRTISARQLDAPAGSYTRRLFDEAGLLESKLLEEAGELLAAKSPSEASWELADLLYFGLVAATKSGGSLEEAIVELELRSKRVNRRKGDAKES